MQPTFDTENHPSEWTLEIIREWPRKLPAKSWPDKDCAGFEALLRFVKQAWKGKDRVLYFKVLELDGMKYEKVGYFPANGESGNEALIAALRENHLFWACCWLASIRGGHYYFQETE